MLMADEAPDKQIETASCRFVVLHHTGHPTEPDHYDLLVEADGGLQTWRVMVAPDTVANECALQPLPHHRRDYLDYEGPVSNNRGRVRRHDSGTCTIVRHATGLEVQFNGERLTGNWVISSEPTESERNKTFRLQRVD